MARTSPTPLYQAEEADGCQEWVSSSYEYGPHRYDGTPLCTCRGRVVCEACRAWPQTKRRRQAPAPAAAGTPTHQYAITTLRWAGVIEVDATGTVVKAPATMPSTLHGCWSWQALRRVLRTKYKHLVIRDIPR